MSVHASGTDAGWSRSAILAIACAAFIVTVSMGIRQSFGLLLQPAGRELGMGREAFGLAIAFQNLLFGVVQPFVGAWADRYGARRVLAAGTAVYVAGLALAALAQSPAGLMAALGICVGIALAGTTFVVLLGAVGRLVAPAQRSVAFGIVTAGGSFGQFAVVPAAQGLIASWGWREALALLAILAITMAVAGLGLRRAPAQAASDARDALPLGEALRQATRHPHYWLLNAGFFVCGFHIAFVATHLPAYLIDRGLGAAIGAWALALIGLFNIAGSWLFGYWGGRQSRPHLLGLIYGARALAIALFLVLPLSNATVLGFAAVFGFLWLGTVPLTSGAVAAMFGLRHLSTLYGIVFLSHQVGSFLGAWSAGRLYDRTGSYDAIWLASIALGLVAAALSAFTRDTPVAHAPRLVRLAA